MTNGACLSSPPPPPVQQWITRIRLAIVVITHCLHLHMTRQYRLKLRWMKHVNSSQCLCHPNISFRSNFVTQVNTICPHTRFQCPFNAPAQYSHSTDVFQLPFAANLTKSYTGEQETTNTSIMWLIGVQNNIRLFCKLCCGQATSNFLVFRLNILNYLKFVRLDYSETLRRVHPRMHKISGAPVPPSDCVLYSGA